MITKFTERWSPHTDDFMWIYMDGQLITTISYDEHGSEGFALARDMIRIISDRLGADYEVIGEPGR